MCRIQVTGSLGISLRLHSRVNIQTCFEHQMRVCFGLAIDKPIILLAKGALVKLPLK